jgi:hypothetical protein
MISERLYITGRRSTEIMATNFEKAPIPRNVVQKEWEAMMARLKEVATVLEHTTQVDSIMDGYVILDPVGTDLPKAEEILFSNLLFQPHARVENGRTIEITGQWLRAWRRYTSWRTANVRLPAWFTANEPHVREFRYALEVEQVMLPG